MMFPFECPRCHGRDYLVGGKVYHLVVVHFLWLRWLRCVPTGAVHAVCTRDDCRLGIVVGAAGVREPVGIVPPVRQSAAAPPSPVLDEFVESEAFVALPTEAREAIKRGMGRREPRPRDPLAGAVRRSEV